MSCLSPLTIKQKGAWRTVPCGRCVFCLEKKRNDWSFRLQKELKVAETAIFLTCTYSDDKVNRVEVVDNETGEVFMKENLSIRDHQLFMKKLRRCQTLVSDVEADDIWNNFKKKIYKPIRFYMVGEYGENTDRPHMHYILFNIDPVVINEIDQIWENGFVKVGKVNDASIHYTTKYCISDHDVLEGRKRPFNCMSKKPGLGSVYVEKAARYHVRNKVFHVKDNNGYKHRIPRYYSEKLFNRVQREIEKEKSVRMADTKIKEIDKKLERRLKNTDIEYYKVQLKEKEVNKKLSYQNKKRKL